MMFSNFRSLIFKLDPETAHNLAIKSLKFNLTPNIFDEDKNNPLKKNIIASNADIYDELKDIIDKKDIE